MNGQLATLYQLAALTLGVSNYVAKYQNKQQREDVEKILNQKLSALALSSEEV